MKVINLYGGPGTGKSTAAAGLFALMKNKGMNVELVTEFAKHLVWAERNKTFDDQLYILAKQNHALEILRGKVDYVITDSPLLLSVIYGAESSKLFKQFVVETSESYDNIDFFLMRQKPYSAVGRMQTENEAKIKDIEIRSFLDDEGIMYHTLLSNMDSPEKLLEEVIYQST